jgi:hypothetical protein
MVERGCAPNLVEALGHKNPLKERESSHLLLRTEEIETCQLQVYKVQQVSRVVRVH